MITRIMAAALMVVVICASGCHTCGHPLFAKSRRCDYCPPGPPPASPYAPPVSAYPPSPPPAAVPPSNGHRYGPSPDIVAPGDAPPVYPVQPSYSPRPYYPRYSP